MGRHRYKPPDMERAPCKNDRKLMIMTTPTHPYINIALVASEDCPLCIEIIDKTTVDVQQGEGHAQVVAVSNPDIDD